MAGSKGRGKKTKGPERGEEVSSSMVPRIFEGLEVVDRLLLKAGAGVDGRGAAERFVTAIEEGKHPSEVIPGLFPNEPRFGGPEEALRLYGNLFGIWDRMAVGDPPASLEAMILRPSLNGAGAEEEPEPPAALAVEALPLQGSIEGRQVPYEVVEGIWQLLASLAPRERTRRQDRYANLQSELSEWARLAEGLSGVGQEILEYLCFELAEMFDHAFGRRFGAVSWKALEEATPGDADRLQPYAADYLSESLEEAEDEDDEALEHEERVLVEALGRRAIVAMTAAVRAAP